MTNIRIVADHCGEDDTKVHCQMLGAAICTTPMIHSINDSGHLLQVPWLCWAFFCRTSSTFERYLSWECSPHPLLLYICFWRLRSTARHVLYLDQGQQHSIRIILSKRSNIHEGLPKLSTASVLCLNVSKLLRDQATKPAVVLSNMT